VSRPQTGNLRERRRADGTALYTARVSAYGNRETVVLGDERDGMTRLMAKRALRELVKDIQVGIWEPSNNGHGGRHHTAPKRVPVRGTAADADLALERPVSAAERVSTLSLDSASQALSRRRAILVQVCGARGEAEKAVGTTSGH
jgi:hypothetical protein